MTTSGQLSMGRQHEQAPERGVLDLSLPDWVRRLRLGHDTGWRAETQVGLRQDSRGSARQVDQATGPGRRRPGADDDSDACALCGLLAPEVVEPNLAPKTAEKYALFVRLYLVPGLGSMRLERLQVRDVRTWLNKLRRTCQCCAQGKDEARPADRRRCCAIGSCCGQVLSDRTVKDVRDTLRAALATAVSEELTSRNVAAVVRLPVPRVRHRQWWSVEEARRFLESARREADPLYAACVLVLVLGLRRGEALGLTWPDVNFGTAEIHIQWQLQRAGGQLHHRATKTPGSTAVLPAPDICVTALQLRASLQAADRDHAGGGWQESDLVFTTTCGTPYELRNFARHFALRCSKAGVRYIKVHDTRRTCASLLVALDVHPRVAMQILRHTQINITMAVYSEVPSATTRNALKRLGRQLDA